MTHSLVSVAAALLEDPKARHLGYAISKSSGIRSGVLYPILGRMLSEGWLVDGWEDVTQISEQRPPRRYYEITDLGRTELGGILGRARADARFSQLRIAARFA